MRVGYSRKTKWSILCVVAVLVSQGNGQSTTTQANQGTSTAPSPAVPPGASTAPSPTPAIPPGTSTAPSPTPTRAVPPGTSTALSPTTAVPPGTSTAAPPTTAVPPGTSIAPSPSPVVPPATSTAPAPTTAAPPATSTTPSPTKQPPQAEFDVYVIVTMEYTWYEFCKVEKDFREEIAEISHDLKGRQLNASDILIVNGEKNCVNPNKTKEGIDVWFVALGSDADKVTIQIGNDLKNLLDSRQLGKLGNRFETKILKVAFGGKNAPRSSSSSNNKKIWLAVGITLAILLPLFILILWKCYPRSRRVKIDVEQKPNHFAMDNVDDEGFDVQEEAHILTPSSDEKPI